MADLVKIFAMVCVATIGMTSCGVGDDASTNEVATVSVSGPPEEALIAPADTLIGEVSDLVLAEPSVGPVVGADSQLETWSLDDSALLTIGDGGSEPGGTLNRVVAALVLRDGRIMVADGAQRAMFYTDDGQYIGHFGGPGERYLNLASWR